MDVENGHSDTRGAYGNTMIFCADHIKGCWESQMIQEARTPNGNRLSLSSVRPSIIHLTHEKDVVGQEKSVTVLNTAS